MFISFYIFLSQPLAKSLYTVYILINDHTQAVRCDWLVGAEGGGHYFGSHSIATECGNVPQLCLNGQSVWGRIKREYVWWQKLAALPSFLYEINQMSRTVVAFNLKCPLQWEVCCTETNRASPVESAWEFISSSDIVASTWFSRRPLFQEQTTDKKK